MRLLPQTIANRIPMIGTIDMSKAGDAVMHCKFCHIGGESVWLVAEYDPDLMVAWGYIELHRHGGFGYGWAFFSVAELELAHLIRISQIERDPLWRPTALRDCLDEEGRIIV